MKTTLVIREIDLSHLSKCNQIWEEMPENEKGRLCLKCQNTIIDFRKKSDEEVAITHLFNEGQVCGLYTKKQLKPLKEKQEQSTVWKSISIGVFGLLALQTNGQEISKEEIKIEQTDQKLDSVPKIVSDQKEDKTVFVDVEIYDEYLNPFVGASILLKGQNTRITTDSLGKGRLDITELINKNEKISFAVSAIGFRLKRVVLTKDNILEKKTISLVLQEKAQMESFEIPARRPFHKRVWRKIQNLFENLSDFIKDKIDGFN